MKCSFYRAAVAELADAQDSKSCESNLMRVQFPPAAFYTIYDHSLARTSMFQNSNGTQNTYHLSLR